MKVKEGYKQCNQCKKVKKLNKNNFYKRARRKADFAFDNRCIDCVTANSRENYRKKMALKRKNQKPISYDGMAKIIEGLVKCPHDGIDYEISLCKKRIKNAKRQAKIKGAILTCPQCLDCDLSKVKPATTLVFTTHGKEVKNAIEVKK